MGAGRKGESLPELIGEALTMVNQLPLPGWSPGEEETIVSLEQMIERFNLDDITKAAAIFDLSDPRPS